MEEIPFSEEKAEFYYESFGTIDEEEAIIAAQNQDYSLYNLFRTIHRAKGVKICEAIQMMNFPYIGVYGDIYEFMPVISFVKADNAQDCRNILPQKAQDALAKLQNDHDFRIENINYFCVNHSSTMFRERYIYDHCEKYARFNMVFHPHFMDYLKPGVEDEKKYVMASLYTDDDIDYGLKRSECSPIMINSENLFTEENWIELYIHKAEDPNMVAISPDNASVLIDLSCPLVHFYSIAIELEEHRKAMKVLVTSHCVFDQTCMLNNFPKNWFIDSNGSINQENCKTTSEFTPDYITNKGIKISSLMRSASSHSFDEIKLFIEFWAWNATTEGNVASELDYAQFLEERDAKESFRHKFLIIDGFLDAFYMLVWARFGAPMIPNYGERYLQECQSTEYLIFLFQGFAKFIAHKYYKAGNIQLTMARDFIDEGAYSQCQIDLVDIKNLLMFGVGDNLEKLEKPENPYERAITRHLDSLVSNPDSQEIWVETLMQIPKIMQDLLFTSIWNLHSKVNGIHPDFGRVSYLNLPEISESYWTSHEQRILEVKNLLSLIKSGDDRI
ncbi:unnamed protein product [Moneuplotes crassus]|uniref:Uncharacterized protein n=1 Tax=Euplotes crassus TaxID=5936 RepID=A0AAD2DBY3_EUPCR|nr:unnamed protein product [Moneuplotes crassus]